MKTAKYLRYKKDMAFSDNLNDFLYHFVENHRDTFVFTDEDDFNEEDIEGTFEKHKQRYKETGKIHIWRGASDNTIFGDAHVNWLFRAWHDYIHITYNLGYDFASETAVCMIQCQQLPISKDWDEERELVRAEIIGQGLYFDKYGEFPKNQRKFIANYVNNVHVALTNKY